MTETKKKARTPVDFGDRLVTPSQKTALVGKVFESVATRYDLMNDLMSFGLHRWWKHVLVRMINPKPGERLLDVAGGTGDITFRLLKQTERKAHVILSDINPAMLEKAKDRAVDQGILNEIEYVTTSAELLPLPDRSVDVYTVAFGLRNMTYPKTVLEEAFRVLKPGGRFFCLEFSKLSIPFLQEIYTQYSTSIIPKIGKLVAQDEESYRYLIESIRKFDDQETLLGKIKNAGFAQARYRNLSGGVVAIHSGYRI